MNNMTEQEYVDKLNFEKEKLKEFEEEYKTILNEYNTLKNSVSKLKYKTENHYWMLGNYYKVETRNTIFYMHVNRITSFNIGEFQCDLVRIVKDEFKNEKIYPLFMSDNVFIKNGWVEFGNRTEYIQITEKEFNEKAEGLPVVNREKE